MSACEVIIPTTENGQGACGEEFEKRAKKFFDAMPPQAKLTFSTICFLLETEAFLRKLKSFKNLPHEQRERILEGWMNSKIMTRRVMFSALKGLCTMIWASIPSNLPHLKKESEKCLEDIQKGL